MEEQKSESVLVGETLAGRRESFSALVRRYQDYAYGVAIGLLSDFELARDVVQESFLCAYRDLNKLKDPSRFGGWLRGIVRHVSYRALRELARVRELAADLEEAEDKVDEAPTPAEAAEEAEQREIVRRALERLNEKNREVVSLYYVDGLSYKDISGFLDVTETTVQGRLQRARAKLRKEIGMVEKTFKKERLTPDFSREIERLLEVVASRGKRHEAAIKRLVEIGSPAVDPLCEALGDPRVPVRRAAAFALCEIGDARALQPVLRLLYSGDWALHKLFRTGRVLSIPGVRDALLRFVREGTGKDRCGAIRVLSRVVDDQEVYNAILAVFRDRENAPVVTRRTALDVLCELRPKSGPELILEAFADPLLGRAGSWWGGWWIAWRNECVLSIDVCLTAFGRNVAPMSRVFAGRLVLRHGPEGKRVLENIMRKGSQDERATAAVALAHSDNGEAFEVLISELLHGYRNRKWVRIVSRTVVRCYGDRVAEWSESNKPEVERCPALVWTLARVRIETGKGTIADVLRCGPPCARAAAVRARARQEGADFVPELREYLRQGRPRKVAQEAFWQMFRLREKALPAVKEMLLSEHWTERKAALCLLRRGGMLTPEQKARAERDSHPAVRHAANWHPSWVNATHWHPKWGKKIADQPG